MKKFYYLLLLFLGMSFMTACDKDDDGTVSLTDKQRFVGTWIYNNPSVTESYERKQIKFTFKSDGKGAYEFLYGDNSRSKYDIIQWWLDENEGLLKYEDEDEDFYAIEYEFEGNDLWMDIFDDDYKYLFKKQ